MGESTVQAERRRALRVPVRGFAVLSTAGAPLHGMIENLSQSGALVSFASRPPEAIEMELRLAEGHGMVAGRIVRIEAHGEGWRVAVAFSQVDAGLRVAIDASIASARGAARTRPILVIDENTVRKNHLITLLSDQGMTPLAPKTPLEAIDLLTRSQLHVGVCLLAPGFGVPSHDLRAVLSDSFPWISVAEITDDLDETTHQALDTWKTTPIARIADATA